MSDYGVERLEQLTINGAGTTDLGSASFDEEIIRLLSSLAASLRDENVREELQGSKIPQILVEALGRQTEDSDTRLAEQVGRVAANYGAENATNLDALLNAGYPQMVLKVLSEGFALFPISASRALIASLLNAIMSDHEPTKTVISEPGHFRMLLAISERVTPNDSALDGDGEARASIAEWLWIIIEAVAIQSPASLSAVSDTTSTLGPLYPIRAFTPPHQNVNPVWWNPLLAILEHYCECLERLSELEVSPNQPTLQHVVGFSEERVIQAILDFVERGTLPPNHDFDLEAVEDGDAVPNGKDESEESSDQSASMKALGKAKASVLKFVTALCWEIPYDPTLPIWRRVRTWLASGSLEDRDDLVGSALICFANGVRDAETALKLLDGENSLLPVILPLLSPDTKVTLQHSVIGLIKNLANPPANKAKLGEAGVIDLLMRMEVFSDKRDMVGTVQGGSAGLIKLLCQSNAKNSSEFVRHPEALVHVLALIKRTDDPNIGYEATRILINAIKSLSSDNRQYVEEMTRLSHHEVITTLVDLLRRTWKWPILINDSLISLTLLTTFGPEGTAGIVMDELEVIHAEKEAEEPLGARVILKIVQCAAGEVSNEIKANTETLMAQLKERVGGRHLEGAPP